MYFSFSLWTYVISQISPLWSSVSLHRTKLLVESDFLFPCAILCNNIFNFFFSSNNDYLFCLVLGGLFLAPESSSKFHSPQLKLKIHTHHLALPCLGCGSKSSGQMLFFCWSSLTGLALWSGAVLFALKIFVSLSGCTENSAVETVLLIAFSGTYSPFQILQTMFFFFCLPRLSWFPTYNYHVV